MNDIDRQIDRIILELRPVSRLLPSVIVLHDLRSMSVAYMSDWGLKILGTTLDELKKMGERYFTHYFHPDDTSAEKIFKMILGNNTEEVYTMFQQVREKRKQGYEWCLYLTSMKILLKDEHNKPVMTIASAHPIQPNTSATEKVKRIIEEKSFRLSRKHLFDALTEREKEILRKIGLGLTNEAIAKKLFISLETVKTHRRNLKKKLRIRQNPELISYAKAFDLI